MSVIEGHPTPGTRQNQAQPLSALPMVVVHCNQDGRLSRASTLDLQRKQIADSYCVASMRPFATAECSASSCRFPSALQASGQLLQAGRCTVGCDAVLGCCDWLRCAFGSRYKQEWAIGRQPAGRRKGRPIRAQGCMRMYAQAVQSSWRSFSLRPGSSLKVWISSVLTLPLSAP